MFRLAYFTLIDTVILFLYIQFMRYIRINIK